MPGLLNAPRLALLAVCVLFLGLSACGGGGGASAASTPAPAPLPPPAPASFSLSGSISVAATVAVDSDVNDPAQPVLANHPISQAQVIPNPVTLGGYVNQPNRGPAGRSFSSGDSADFFRVSLGDGQTLSLVIANASTSNDLDLHLYDESFNLVASATGSGSGATLTAPATADFLVEVRAVTGASGYVLTIGQDITGTSSAEAVPGEVIVQFREQRGASGVSPSLAQRLQDLGMDRVAGAEGRATLLRLEDAAQRQQVFTALGLPRGALQGLDATGQLRRDTDEVIRALRARSDVACAEPNYIRKANFIPNDAEFFRQWHYSLIKLPAAWDVSTGSGVRVAVVDTGLLTSHPDLQGQFSSEGFDFISSPARARDGDGIDADPSDPGDEADGTSTFHGTHVAGTVAAATNNVTGVAGVAFNATLLPLRVLGLNGGTSYDVQQAVLYAAGLPNDSGRILSPPVDVINLSLGGPGFSLTEQETFSRVRNQGVIIVAAAGNNSGDVPSYPASYDGVVSVSAVDLNKNLAPYSNFGPAVDVAAPGGDLTRDRDLDGNNDGVFSTHGDDSSGSIVLDFAYLQGTSMATPHVTGVAALMKGVDAGLTPDEFDAFLASGAITEDLGDPGRDELFGYGLIDGEQAVLAVQGGSSTPQAPVLVAMPRLLDFGTSGTSTALSMVNGGGGTLTVNSVIDQQATPWLNISAPSSSDGLGVYQVSVNRDSVVEGTHTTTLRFTSTANTVDVPVVMQKPSVSLTGDGGFQYVLLLDADSGQAQEQDGATVSNGRYVFALPGVAAGDYQLVAGSDLNNDGFICGIGEACGAYTSLDQLQTLSVSSNMSGLNFSSSYLGFSVGVGGSATSSMNPIPRPGPVSKQFAAP